MWQKTHKTAIIFVFANKYAVPGVLWYMPFQIPSEICGEEVRKGLQEVYGIWEATAIHQIGSTVLSVSLVDLLSLKNCLFHVSACLYPDFSSHFESNWMEYLWPIPFIYTKELKNPN